MQNFAIQYTLTDASNTSGKMGTNPTTDRTMAGGFQILNVQGTDLQFFDGTKGDPREDGDQWYVRFIGVPRYGIDSGATTAFPVRVASQGPMQTGSVSATVRIADDFSQTVTATILSNRLRFKAASHFVDGIYDLALDGTHFVHVMHTNVLTSDETGMPQAITQKNLSIFKLGLDVTGYSGENGRVIAPNGFVWQQR